MLLGLASLVHRTRLWRLTGYAWRPAQRIHPLACGRRPQTERALSFSNGGQAHGTLSAGTAILRKIRVFRPSRQSGSSFRREDALSHRDCRRENGDLHRLDEIGILHFDRRKPGDRRALCFFCERPSDRTPDCRPASRRLGPPADELRLRTTPQHRQTPTTCRIGLPQNLFRRTGFERALEVVPNQPASENLSCRTHGRSQPPPTPSRKSPHTLETTSPPEPAHTPPYP